MLRPAAQKFNQSDLDRVQFVNADLRNADFSDARLERTNFTGSDLTSAIFSSVNMRLANFSDCNLSMARGLRQDRLDTACGNSNTILPAGLTIPDCPADIKSRLDSRVGPNS